MSARTGVLLLALFGVNLMGTVVLGWWTVPLFGVIWGWFSPMRLTAVRAANGAALCAALAWGLLLGWAALHGPLGELARRLGVVMHLPAPALLVITLLFPAALAWSAAVVGGLLSRSQRGAAHQAQ
jgi:hypothetical protein